ncbi:HEAT repeat-containing protein 4-like isoform X2 [Branchiostoma floridae]|uniref:HEAT repeat-containing protein 4-like isoform X2 n=1 Tax=Branchiostoma floridae TaxID=7739 RepID=A0A9J7HTZ7_BRAFL|nr:HEAT repeat-containing protein 4-like isoform X2 [Branchiostoma floridae]
MKSATMSTSQHRDSIDRPTSYHPPPHPPPSSYHGPGSVDRPLFPVGSGIKIPQIGDHAPAAPSSPFVPVTYLTREKTDVPTAYLKKISCDLTFTPDVVESRAVHTLPYSSDRLKQVLDYRNIIKVKTARSKIVDGRHDRRGLDTKHLPCHLQRRHPYRLRPLGKKEQQRQEKDAQDEEVTEPETTAFLTEVKERKGQKKGTDTGDVAEVRTEGEMAAPTPVKTRAPHDWDEYVMTKLSRGTARWIVRERVPAGEQKERLDSFLVQRYGKRPEFVYKEETSLSLKQDRSKKKVTIKEPTKGKGTAPTSPESKSVVPYEDPSQTLGTFYQLPGRHSKKVEYREPGATNNTADVVQVKPLKPPPPPTLEELLNPALEVFIYRTTNQFERELLSGMASQVYQKTGDRHRIFMDSHAEYKTELQTQYPPDPLMWLSEEEREQARKPTKIIKGLQRWTKLPEPADFASEGGVVPPKPEDTSPKKRDDGKQKAREERDADPLLRIVEEWRDKFYLKNQWQDCTIDDLLKSMEDVHEITRLIAVTVCCRAAAHRALPDDDLSNESGMVVMKAEVGPKQGVLPIRLVEGVERLLEDPVLKVRMASAICFYTMDKHSDKARVILYSMLQEGGPAQRWLAAQCLATAGEVEPHIVSEIVFQLFNTNSDMRRDQAIIMLSKMSQNTTLVHSMLAEQLNSSSWTRRVLSCKVIPKLYGPINKDLMHKLSTLMWHDWSSEVRKAAAQTLGRTGHGKEVHNNLHSRLTNGNEREKIDALNKIGHLGIMTARLLPPFMECFQDPYISVRIEVCNTAGHLRITDDAALNTLLEMAQFDPCWKVKAHAIHALGQIGMMTEEIVEKLLWALKYDDTPGVRAQACRAITELGLHDEDVIAVLQDRTIVEPDDIVRSEVVEALQSLGLTPTGDLETLQAIKNEVGRLCTRGNVAAKITKKEQRDDRTENKGRLLSSAEPPVTKERAVTSRSKSRSSAHPTIVVSEDGLDRMDTPWSVADAEIRALMQRRASAGLSPEGHRAVPDQSTPEEGESGETHWTQVQTYHEVVEPAAGEPPREQQENDVQMLVIQHEDTTVSETTDTRSPITDKETVDRTKSASKMSEGTIKTVTSQTTQTGQSVSDLESSKQSVGGKAEDKSGLAKLPAEMEESDVPPSEVTGSVMSAASPEAQQGEEDGEDGDGDGEEGEDEEEGEEVVEQGEDEDADDEDDGEDDEDDDDDDG